MEHTSLNSHCIGSSGIAEVEWEESSKVEYERSSEGGYRGCNRCGLLRLGSWSGERPSLKIQ